MRVIASDDGAKRIKVGDRVTGMPLIPTLLDESARLKWMDEAQIDVQLVSGWMDLAGYHLPPEAAAWLARVQNDALAQIVASRPDRYADNLYYDTILHDDAALRFLISRVSAHRVALGSDYPFPLRDPDPVAPVQRQETNALYERVVCWDTGAELLGLK